MSNVISIFKNGGSDVEYKRKIAMMDKLELLEEMVSFQEERSRVGGLTRQMMERGIILFGALEQSSETPELKILTRSYLRHLRYELEALEK
jgi:hypothetical protein